MRRLWTSTLAFALLIVAGVAHFCVAASKTAPDIISCNTGSKNDEKTEESVNLDPSSDISFAAKDTRIDEAIDKLDAQIRSANTLAASKPSEAIKEVPDTVKPKTSASGSRPKNGEKKKGKAKGSRRKGAKENKPETQKLDQKSSSTIESSTSSSSTSTSTVPAGMQEPPANSKGRRRGSKKSKNDKQTKTGDKSKNLQQKKLKVALKGECKKCLKGAVTLVSRIWKESEKDYQLTASETCSRLHGDKTRQQCIETYKASYLANDKFSTLFYCKTQCPAELKLDDLPARYHPALKVPKVKLVSWRKIQKRLEKERKQQEKNKKDKSKNTKKPGDDTVVGPSDGYLATIPKRQDAQPVPGIVSASPPPPPPRQSPTVFDDDYDNDDTSVTSSSSPSRYQPSYRDEEQSQSRLRDAADSMDPQEREGFCSWCVSTMTQGVKQKKDEVMDSICKCQNCFDVFGGNMDPKAALCTVGTNVAAVPTQYATSISGLLGVCTPTCAGIKIWQTTIGGLGKLIFRSTV